jgi:hypothetical protein
MSVLDAKVIHTKYGMETYLDQVKTIEINGVQLPTTNSPFYELKLGIEYLLLGEGKYYDSRRNYFSIQMSEDHQVISLKEPDTESLFALKNDGEREATKELVGEWLFKTNAFKQAVSSLMNKLQVDHAGSTEDNRETIKFLEDLRMIDPVMITQASFNR